MSLVVLLALLAHKVSRVLWVFRGRGGHLDLLVLLDLPACRVSWDCRAPAAHPVLPALQAQLAFPALWAFPVRKDLPVRLGRLELPARLARPECPASWACPVSTAQRALPVRPGHPGLPA